MKISIVLVILTSTFLLGCKKESKLDLNEIYSFTGTIDNIPIRWQVKATDNFADTSRYRALAYYFYGQWPIDCATTDCYDVGAGTWAEERNSGNGIQVLFLQAQKTFDINELKDLFTSGFKSYGSQRTSAYTITHNGILIRYTENGKLWQSEGGDQTGSTFESVDFKETTINNNRYSNVWRARFSCKVYFSGLSPKTLQNCEIYGPAFNK